MEEERLMKIFIVILSLICASVCFADDPSVTCQINAVAGQKEYVYTLLNKSEYGIEAFWLSMPEAGARSVISLTGPPSWYASGSFRGDSSFWGVSGLPIPPGGQGVFVLTTADTVPTAYNFQPPYNPSNWAYVYWTEIGAQVLYGSNNLPVPAPEPSALAALVTGLAGFGALVRRRKVRTPAD
jgi:hypothetical protein